MNDQQGLLAINVKDTHVWVCLVMLGDVDDDGKCQTNTLCSDLELDEFGLPKLPPADEMPNWLRERVLSVVAYCVQARMYGAPSEYRTLQ